MLTDVSRTPLRDKLIHLMAIVSYFSTYLVPNLKEKKPKNKITESKTEKKFIFEQVIGLKIEKSNHSYATLRSFLSLPAKAKSNVVFPEPGGPKSKVSLQKHTDIAITHRPH